MLWDIEHTVRHGEQPIDTATQLRRYIEHVHVKDSIRKDGKNVQKLLGDGDIPLADAVRRCANWDMTDGTPWKPRSAGTRMRPIRS